MSLIVYCCCFFGILVLRITFVNMCFFGVAAFLFVFVFERRMVEWLSFCFKYSGAVTLEVVPSTTSKVTVA